MTFPSRCFCLFSLLVAAVATVFFVPALSGGFVLDDGFNILQNRLLYVEVLSADNLTKAALSFHDGVGGRPLPMLSFALDYWRAGSMDATVFKTTNLFIHGCTVYFLALFLRRLLLLADWAPASAAAGALVLALAWGIHPMQVSSVMYVVQRMQTMETLFLVLALWSYLGVRQIQISGAGRGRLQGIAVAANLSVVDSVGIAYLCLCCRSALLVLGRLWEQKFLQSGTTDDAGTCVVHVSRPDRIPLSRLYDLSL